MFGSRGVENLCSTRAIDHSDLPRNVFGPTNSNLAVKSVLLGTPRSSNKGRPPQSPRFHHGRASEQKNAPTTSVTHTHTPKPAVRPGRRNRNDFDIGEGQLRRAAKSQKTPGITIAPQRTTKDPRERNSKWSNRKNRGDIGTVHKLIRAATFGFPVAANDAPRRMAPAAIIAITAAGRVTSAPETMPKTNMLSSTLSRTKAQLASHSTRPKLPPL